MYDETSMMILNTVTSTHPGSGTELGYVDLPIQREAHTEFPKIEASTLKGCIRSAVYEKTCKSADGKEKQNEIETINTLFGAPDKGDYASAISITDARILFFPVKSVIGIFAWVTCPYVIQRFMDDYKVATGNDFCKNHKFSLPQVKAGNAVVTKDSKLIHSVEGKNKIMLEDYTYQTKDIADFQKFLEIIAKNLPQQSMNERFIDHAVLLSDDDFTSFVKYSTEIHTRIKINPSTGTVDGTALFTEEYLPPECIFYSLVFFMNPHSPQDLPAAKKTTDGQSTSGQGKKGRSGEKVSDAVTVKQAWKSLFNMDMIQVGADQTLGKGLIRRSFWGESETEKEGNQNE